MVSRKVPWGGKDAPESEAESSDLGADSSGKSPGKSAVTNGSRWLVGVDGRNPWSRRCRDVARALVADHLGGRGAASAAQLALARRAAVLIVQLEMLEAKMAEGDMSLTVTDHYGRGCSHLRRLLTALTAPGLERKAKNITSPVPGMSRALYDLYVLEGKIDPVDEETEQ